MTLLALLALVAISHPLAQAPAGLLALGPHHARHYEFLHSGVPRYNGFVLKAIDTVQAHAMDGGGYFIGVKAVPAESPVGYPVSLLEHPLLSPPRTTSYCSGSTYAAFIEALDLIFQHSRRQLDSVRVEAMRMQEPDGSRREDRVKAWGWWNADGFGSDFCLVQYLKIGRRISPVEAKPGDFVNISWKSGLGHSVVFLGWCTDSAGRPAIDYWASQRGTNGFGDQMSALSSIKEMCVVRLTRPAGLFDFDLGATIDTSIAGDRPPQIGKG